MKLNLSLGLQLGIKSCLVCGSYQMQEHELCSVCSEKIIQKIRYQKGKIAISEHRLWINFVSLIDWVPSESDHLSRLFLKIKGDKQKKAWAFLAKQLLKESVLSNERSFHRGQAVIIPCPSKSPRPDHAEQWASSLSQELGWKYLTCLQWRKERSVPKQRFKNRSERLDFQKGKHVKFTVDPAFSSGLNAARDSEALFVFADDIITTGSTAVQAYLSLGQPKNFMVISLGRRAVAKNSPIW